MSILRTVQLFMAVIAAVLLASCGGGGSGGTASTAAAPIGTSSLAPWLGTKQLGAVAQATYGYSVATDVSGNVYVAGVTTGGLDGNTLTGIRDFFVTKYNSSGVKVFTRQMGVAGGWTHGEAVATDASGNVFVAGNTTGGLDGNTLTGAEDFFVTKYDSSGEKQ